MEVQAQLAHAQGAGDWIQKNVGMFRVQRELLKLQVQGKPRIRRDGLRLQIDRSLVGFGLNENYTRSLQFKFQLELLTLFMMDHPNSLLGHRRCSVFSPEDKALDALQSFVGRYVECNLTTYRSKSVLVEVSVEQDEANPPPHHAGQHTSAMRQYLVSLRVAASPIKAQDGQLLR
jgi:hypothetical protein